MTFFYEIFLKDSDNVRCRKLTLKVIKLQTAEDQKYVVRRSLYQKSIFPEFTHLYIP